ncbi:MAG TPA: hypothetical protein P5136_00095 [Methanofastidiosum sp.]|nr:hypothetical protein [Methanofastidiosum sp.]
MNLFIKIAALIETALNGKKYQEEKDKLRLMDLAMWKMFPTPQVGPYVDHPGYSEHIKECQKNFIDYATKSMKYDSDRTIGFGDSILAQAKDRIKTVIDPRLNFSLGGMWAHHMLKNINDMVPLFLSYGFMPKKIVIGTPNGNAILVHQEINSVNEQSLIVLNRLRQLFPTSRIIIYGIPMTIVSYAIQNFAAYDTALFKWMMSDINSVMLPLIKGFVENYHILPKADMNSDGVHMTPKGQVFFGELIEHGKMGAPRRLINQ